MKVQPPAASTVICLLYAAALCWLLLVEIGTAAWYRVHERNLVSARVGVCNGRRVAEFSQTQNGSEIRAVLRFDEGEAAAWTLTSVPVNGSRSPILSPCLLYVFRWKPGQKARFWQTCTGQSLFAGERLEPGGGQWRPQLSRRRFVRVAVSPFRIPTRIRRFPAANSARILLFIGRSRCGTLRVSWQHGFARNVRKPFRMDARRTSSHGVRRPPSSGTAGHPSNIRQQRADLRSRRGIASARSVRDVVN